MTCRPEVLAPAGSPEALQAAVRCGAAAVYLGAGDFNARRAAHNFSPDELREAVAYCHGRGVKVHLTLNTLVRDDELEDAMATAAYAAAIGVDALIVQDVGLARRLHAAMPQMPLHASTQLSCHTPAGVEFLRDAGFSRVVPAREMSRDEIAACTGKGVELEVFVHGALCMSVSGQCYFSAMLGGRSGNRGACAQTCRLPFAPTGDKPIPCPPDKGALSLKDNCLLDYMADLAALGIDSVKIEGRMKRPEYVAAATAVYRAAADGKAVSPQELENLQRVFSRSGFTDGYYTARRGGAMFGLRRKEDVVAAAGVLKDLQHTYDKETPRMEITGALSVGDRETHLTVTDGEHTVTVTSDAAEAAIRRPLDPDRAREQLEKTGGTPFRFTSLTAEIGDGLTLPMSALNDLRRRALEQLLTRREAPVPVPVDLSVRPAALPAIGQRKTPMRWVRLANIAQWSPVLTADAVFLPLGASAEDIRRIAESKTAVGVEIPRGMFGAEDSLRRQLTAAKQAGATLALCGNVGAIPLASEAGLAPVGGFGLNVMNSEALAFFRERGLAAATLSMELTFAQMRAMSAPPLPTGLLVYGRQPLMLTRNCPRSSALGSCKDCHGQGITDRTGTVFPVMCAGGCSEVLNSVPLYWGDHPEDIPPADFWLFHFTDETADEVAKVMNDYEKHAPAPTRITRGLYRRGVE